MPSWNDLIQELDSIADNKQKGNWIQSKFQESLINIGKLRKDRNVIFYSSAFLQKPQAPPIFQQITHEDINGFMSVMNGMDWDKGLTLLLHTPGGVTNATESIVSYIRSKFKYFEVIIPTYAMSAGTMISLSADNIIMGRQSQMGPIDPQMPMGGRIASALAVIDQFERAKKEILANRETAHLWAPILPSLGPAMLQEAQNAIDYSEKIVADWLMKYMMSDDDDSKKQAQSTARYFSRGSSKKSHGRRIDRDEARSQKIKIEDLESDQSLQEWVLTAYHLVTILYEKSPAIKILQSQHGKSWVKNITMNGPM